MSDKLVEFDLWPSAKKAIAANPALKPFNVDKEIRTVLALFTTLTEVGNLDAVIAGGCFYTWAAGLPAHDVDFFVENSDFAQGFLSGLGFGRPEKMKELGKDTKDSYYLSEENYYIYKKMGYKGAVVDIILTPSKAYRAVEKFDYKFSMNFWKPHRSSAEGAKYYGQPSWAEQRNKHVRDKKHMETKLVPELWGNPACEGLVKGVMADMDRIYKELKL